MQARLRLTRRQILAFRRRVGGLDERVPTTVASLRRAAWAGLQDSMPRAALLSLHARLIGVEPSTWEHPSLVQVWGPRYSTYVVAERDFALFTLARLPERGKSRARAEQIAERLRAYLDGARTTDREAGLAIRANPRYAAPTGTVAIRWEGARAPTIWTVPAPGIEPADACRELARRYLHVFGPTTADGFARWAGISRRAGADAFAALAGSLLPVRSPLGEELLLADDEPAMRAAETAPAPARLLPSGDAYFLLDGAERELLVPRADGGSCSGPRGSGRAHSSSRARSAAPGGVPSTPSGSMRGGARRASCAMRSRPRPPPCRSPGSTGRSTSSGTPRARLGPASRRTSRRVPCRRCRRPSCQVPEASRGPTRQIITPITSQRRVTTGASIAGPARLTEPVPSRTRTSAPEGRTSHRSAAASRRPRSAPSALRCA